MFNKHWLDGSHKNTTRLTLLLFVAIIAVYWPGLTGPFMLDDFGSLPTLFDKIDLWGKIYATFDMGTGPTGRPVSFLTFALQHNQWPEPYYFKLVNVLIHATNAALVFWFLRLITPRLPFPKELNLTVVSLAAAALWALHPIQVSTTLYVIQRMVLLSSFFMLLGCIAYVYGRIHLEKENLKRGYTLITLSLGIFGTLALLSKEIGFQLILYIFCLELFLFHTSKPKFFRYWKALFIGTPVLAFVAYLAYKFDSMLISYETLRYYTMDERVLTQFKILIEYIVQTIFPRISELGIFHDNYPPLRSWHSLESLTYISMTTGLIVSSIFFRRQHPIYAFIFLWFFLGHSMEASIISLELYFEHRNYLPSLTIILGIVTIVYWLALHIRSTFIDRVYISTIALIFALLVGLTAQQTLLWGNNVAYSVTQTKEHPDSIRARALMISVLASVEKVEEAYKESVKMKEQFQRPSLWLLELDYACAYSQYRLPHIAELRDIVDRTKLDIAAMKKLTEIVEYTIDGECDALSGNHLLEIIGIFDASPNYKTLKDDITTLKALTYWGVNNNTDKAIEALSPDTSLGLDNRLLLARLLATTGRLNESLSVIERAYDALPAPPQYAYRLQEINELHTAVEKDYVTLQNTLEQTQ